MGGDPGDRAEGGHHSPPPHAITAHSPPPCSPLLRPGAGACSAQTRCLQRTTTLISEMGSAGKRLPPLHRVTRRRGHFQDFPVRLGPCTTTSAISGPSRFLRVLPPPPVLEVLRGQWVWARFCHFGAVTARSQQGFGAPGSIPRHQAPHRMGAGCQHQLQSL